MSANRKPGQYNTSQNNQQYNYPNAGNPIPQGRTLGGPNDNSRIDYRPSINRVDLNSRFQNDPRSDPRCKKIDQHELMKQQMLLQGPGDDNSGNRQPTVVDYAPEQAYSLGTPINDKQAPAQVVNKPEEVNAVEDTYITFDSFYKNETSVPAQGNLIFSITNINNNQSVDNIVMMHISQFYLPTIANLDPTAPDYFFFREMFMKVDALPSTQSYQRVVGGNYQYKFDLSGLNSIATKATPDDDTVYFKTPIQTLTQLSIALSRSPFNQVVQLPIDIITVQLVNNSSPARFTLTNATFYDIETALLNTTSGFVNTATATTYYAGTASQTGFAVTGVGTTFLAGMVGGIIVYSNGTSAPITVYNTPTSLTVGTSLTVATSNYVIYYGTIAANVKVGVWLQNLITPDLNVNLLANRASGHFVTSVINTNTIEIAGLDFTTVNMVTPAICKMYVGKNRIEFTLRFTSLKQQKTNGITPVHV